ncbi:DUF6493 family protein [Apibacter sp. HY039]|uniref:DUF6493 family protein n=1 Tax=Apibacter sp. HY039 TaxID=2501476 RepID=UPI000FEBE6A7|nr:DUF6493 family protein [Apibacter sp. HY039]
MLHKEKFFIILEEKKVFEIIPFLKSLTLEERKTLAKPVRQSIKNAQEETDKRNNDTFVILSIAAFVCFNYSDYVSNYIYLSYLSSGFIKFHEYTQGELMKKIRIEDVLCWYCPDWIDTYLNKTDNFEAVTYDEIIHWTDKGYIKPSPELISHNLVRYIYQYHPNQTIQHTFHPERLLQYPNTLKEHIWYLFQYKTDINHPEIYYGMENPENDWIKAIQLLVENKQTDRLRILAECVKTANQGFNKTLSGWFFKLFNALHPTPSELIQLQEHLWPALSSPQTSVVGIVLNYSKSIKEYSEFDFDAFLFYLPNLLSSPTKAIVKSSLDLAEYLLKNKKGCSEKICEALGNGFISRDESIQKRLAKLLISYGNPTVLKTKLSPNTDYILSSVKPQLQELLEITSVNPDDEENVEIQPSGMPIFISHHSQIEEITTLDEFQFFINQVFENNEPWHIFWLPVYIQKFKDEIIKDPDLLASALKIAVKAFMNQNYGRIDNVAASFLISYAKYLIEQYPENTGKIKAIVVNSKVPDLTSLKTRFVQSYLTPLIHIYMRVYEQLKKGIVLPLLSTPTHTPHWIEPSALISRLAEYQHKKEEPFSFDLQLAIQRCCLENASAYIEMAQKKLTGELKDLILFLLDSTLDEPNQVEYSAWWMTVALTRNPNKIPKMKSEWGYDYLNDDYFTDHLKWEVLVKEKKYKIKLPYYTLSAGKSTLYMEYLIPKKICDPLRKNDAYHLGLSMPHNKTLLEVHILNSLNDPTSSSSDVLVDVCSMLQILQTTGINDSDFNYHFLAHSWLYPNKTARDIVSSLWVEYVQQQKLDSSKLGKELGRLNTNGWLPVKRLTDALDMLLNISSVHDKELICLIENILLETSEPYTNMRKLLEIYKELLLIANQKSGITEKLEAWKDEKNCKKVILEILKQ